MSLKINIIVDQISSNIKNISNYIICLDNKMFPVSEFDPQALCSDINILLI